MLVLGSVGPQRGIVSAFDSAAGYGTVRTHDGTDWWFHCTSIADGTRDVDVGVARSFRLAPGRAGRWEAIDLVG